MRHSPICCPPPARRIALRAFAVLALAGTGTARADQALPAGSLYGLAPAADAPIGGRYVLLDHAGAPLEVGGPYGRSTLLFFGFASCPSVCPTTLADARAVTEALGAQAPRVVFVTIDPERDTPDVLARYVTAFHPAFIGARADDATRHAMLADYRVAVRRHAGELAGGHTFDHSAWLYLLDAAGRVRLLWPFGTPAERVIADLRRLQGGP